MNEVKMNRRVNEKVIRKEIAQQGGGNSGADTSKSNRHRDAAEERKHVTLSQDGLEADANRKSQGGGGEGNPIPECDAGPPKNALVCP